MLYKYILIVLDGYTRYAWVVPLKDKKEKQWQTLLKK